MEPWLIHQHSSLEVGPNK